MTTGPVESVSIAPARREDVPIVLDFIRQLAAYERLLHAVVATEEDIDRALFGPQPSASALIARIGDTPVGFAVYFFNFSTFVGRPGLYLEDLFVLPSARGRGIGRALLERLAHIALERGCGRMEWAVLDWNAPAINFYRKLGAIQMHDWTVFRLEEDRLREMAGGTAGEVRTGGER